MSIQVTQSAEKDKTRQLYRFYNGLPVKEKLRISQMNRSGTNHYLANRIKIYLKTLSNLELAIYDLELAIYDIDITKED